MFNCIVYGLINMVETVYIQTSLHVALIHIISVLYCGYTSPHYKVCSGLTLKLPMLHYFKKYSMAGFQELETGDTNEWENLPVRIY